MKTKHLSLLFASVFALAVLHAPDAGAAEKKATPVASSAKESSTKASAQKAAQKTTAQKAPVKETPPAVKAPAASKTAAPADAVNAPYAPPVKESTSFFKRIKNFFSSEKKPVPAGSVTAMPPPVPPMVVLPRPPASAGPIPSMPSPNDDFSAREKRLDSKALREAKGVAELFDVKGKLKGALRGSVMMMIPMVAQENAGKIDKIQKSIDAVVEEMAEDKEDIVLRNKAIFLAGTFTADELGQLEKFLETPVGKKMIKLTGEMDQNDAMFIQNIVMYESPKARSAALKEMKRNDLKIPKGLE